MSYTETVRSEIQAILFSANLYAWEPSKTHQAIELCKNKFCIAPDAEWADWVIDAPERPIPPVLYHYTRSANVESVKRYGIMPASRLRPEIIPSYVTEETVDVYSLIRNRIYLSEIKFAAAPNEGDEFQGTGIRFGARGGISRVDVDTSKIANLCRAHETRTTIYITNSTIQVSAILSVNPLGSIDWKTRLT